jgi:hypothetical protein
VCVCVCVCTFFGKYQFWRQHVLRKCRLDGLCGGVEHRKLVASSICDSAKLQLVLDHHLRFLVELDPENTRIEIRHPCEHSPVHQERLRIMPSKPRDVPEAVSPSYRSCS